MAPSCSVVAFHQGTEALPAPSLGLTFPSPSGTPSPQVLVRRSATLTLTQEISINPHPGLRRPATPSDTRALTKSGHGEHLDSTGKTRRLLATRQGQLQRLPCRRGQGCTKCQDSAARSQGVRGGGGETRHGEGSPVFTCLKS